MADDSLSYAPGLVRDVASPPWTAHANTSYAAIEDDGTGTNQGLSFGSSSGFYGASRPLPQHGEIEEGEVATFFFRFL